jgi:hypothetical protein
VRATDRDGKQPPGTPADEAEETEVTVDELAEEEAKPEPVEEE